MHLETYKAAFDFAPLTNLKELRVSQFRRSPTIIQAEGPYHVWYPINLFDSLPPGLELLELRPYKEPVEVNGLANELLQRRQGNLPTALHLECFTMENHKQRRRVVEQWAGQERNRGIKKFMTQLNLACLTYTQLQRSTGPRKSPLLSKRMNARRTADGQDGFILRTSYENVEWSPSRYALTHGLTRTD